MSTRISPAPLPELAAAAPLDHIEAVTIVREVVQRVGGGELPGVPSAHVTRLSASGALSVEGPIAAGGFPVRRAAHLLETLLPGFGTQLRVPGALRLIVTLARIEPVARRRWDTRRIVAALTIPALLAIGAAPAWWQHSAAARRETQRQVTETAVRVVQRPVREIEAGVREAEVRRRLAPRKPVHTSGVVIRQAAYRPAQPAAVKSNRPSAAKSTKAPQVRRAASANKGPRKWGIWVLNKVGVKIVNTEQ